MLKKYKMMLLTLILGILTGCSSSTVDCDVVAYHTLGAPEGETVRIEPQDTKLIGTPEFAYYASQIRAQLNKTGYRQAAGDSANLIFAIKYGTTDGPEEIARFPKCFTRYRYIEDDFGSPYYRGLECYDNFIEIQSSYIHSLALEVYRPIAPGDPGEMIYQGIVNNISKSSNLSKIMPYLAAALFDDFPGESGEVRNVAVDKSRKTNE